jgi:transcriptional regulator with XRE-family HTH domain
LSGETLAPMPLSPEEVGARIVHAREAKMPKPWSQFDLALAMGVSPSTIYRWEKGKLPSMNELMRLADVLDVPLDHFTEPPERQAALSDLLDLLESSRAEAERGRDALIASLSSLDSRLSRIEAELGIQDGQDSEAR